MREVKKAGVCYLASKLLRQGVMLLLSSARAQYWPLTIDASPRYARTRLCCHGKPVRHELMLLLSALSSSRASASSARTLQATCANRTEQQVLDNVDIYCISIHVYYHFPFITKDPIQANGFEASCCVTTCDESAKVPAPLKEISTEDSCPSACVCPSLARSS